MTVESRVSGVNCGFLGFFAVSTVASESTDQDQWVFSSCHGLPTSFDDDLNQHHQMARSPLKHRSV